MVGTKRPHQPVTILYTFNCWPQYSYFCSEASNSMIEHLDSRISLIDFYVTQTSLCLPIHTFQLLAVMPRAVNKNRNKDVRHLTPQFHPNSYVSWKVGMLFLTSVSF